MWHILPRKDSEEHEMSTTCRCGVSVEFEEEMIATHSAFDGRDVEDSTGAGWIGINTDPLYQGDDEGEYDEAERGYER